MFLAEHYHSRGELDKASAASRQLMRVADGETSTKFAVTPLDVDLLLDKKRHTEKRLKRLRPIILTALAVELLMFACAGLAPSFSGENMANLRITFCPWDSSSFVNKARFEFRRQEWAASAAHCDQALSLKPGDEDAYRLKAEIAFAQSDYATALRFVNLAGLDNFRTVDLKSQILFRQGEFRSSALIPLVAINSGVGRKDADVAASSVYSFAYAGEYDAALAAAQKQADWATGTWARREAQVMQAQMLLKLGRHQDCIRLASLALGDLKKPWTRMDSRAYLYRAESKFALKDYAGALEDINHSMATQMFAARQYETRIAILLALGRNAEAHEAIREEIAFNQFNNL